MVLWCPDGVSPNYDHGDAEYSSVSIDFETVDVLHNAKAKL